MLSPALSTRFKNVGHAQFASLTPLANRAPSGGNQVGLVTVSPIGARSTVPVQNLVGRPGQDRPGLTDAGSVEVYLGSTAGLRWSQTLAMGLHGIPGPKAATSGDGRSCC